MNNKFNLGKTSFVFATSLALVAGTFFARAQVPSEEKPIGGSASPDIPSADIPSGRTYQLHSQPEPQQTKPRQQGSGHTGTSIKPLYPSLMQHKSTFP